MVDFPGFPRFHHKADARAGMGFDQVMMHGAGGEERAHGDPFGAHRAIGKHDQARALINGGRGFIANALQRTAKPGFPRALFIGDIDDLRGPAAMINVLQRRRLFVGQNGVGHPQAMGMAARGFEEVLLRADVALKAHDHLFPDRIDGRIGDLGEELLEVVVEHAGLVG